MSKMLLGLTSVVVGSMMAQAYASESPRYVPGELIVKFKPA